MAEPFKNLIHEGTVRSMAAHLSRVDPGFEAARFQRRALRGLTTLELKARAMQLCAALEDTLPTDFSAAADRLEAALGTPSDPLAPPHAPARDDGLRGWCLWAAGEFVARRGLAHPERALAALHAITQRFTAEWAIRPFVQQHAGLTFATLARWAHDDSAHVRRLVSEGTRPRLPWGIQLRELIADPSPTLPLLRALQDDVNDYVRRSVANHLNDIAKDHPDLVVGWLQNHLHDAPPERRALLRHACRTLIKNGHAPTLKAWGQGQPLRGSASLTLSPTRARVGDTLTLYLELRSTAARPQSLLIDYVWHRMLANGNTAPKVFKGWQVELGGGETALLTKRHSLREVTTRRNYPGRHRIEVVVNGRSVAQADFELKLR
ncbi:MAG TPA: DNA alkylation repair protein [Burkholderiaceae bacterium]